jgi:hypothetical protein
MPPPAPGAGAAAHHTNVAKKFILSLKSFTRSAAGANQPWAQAHPADAAGACSLNLSPGKVPGASVSQRPKLRPRLRVDGFGRDLQDLMLMPARTAQPYYRLLPVRHSFPFQHRSEQKAAPARLVPPRLPKSKPRTIRNVQPVRCQGQGPSDQGNKGPRRREKQGPGNRETKGIRGQESRQRGGN